MNALKNAGNKTFEAKIHSRKVWWMLLVFVLVAVMLSAQGVKASGQCPAPGTGLPGALNMLHDATMWTIPMARDAAQGNAGMFTAVNNTSCP